MRKNGGLVMPGWFDIISLSDASEKEDEKGILAAVQKVHGIIDEQIDKGVSSERIVLGGFSQGGAVALLGGLTCKHKLGGIVGLSTWLPLHQKFAEMEINSNRETPVFLVHGELDIVVKYAWGKSTRQALEEKLGYNVEWHSYPNLDHSANLQEVVDMEKWLQTRLPTEG
jgi:predicted esterase